jgi:ubiquinone/menaquinone biosynthesis C-methylase UbiE
MLAADLGVLQQLADRVGPTGRVVGLDRERRMLDTARQVIEQRSLPAEFLQADATDTGLLGGSFDLVMSARCS